jgi:hypothetical protein
MENDINDFLTEIDSAIVEANSKTDITIEFVD